MLVISIPVLSKEEFSPSPLPSIRSRMEEVRSPVEEDGSTEVGGGRRMVAYNIRGGGKGFRQGTVQTAVGVFGGEDFVDGVKGQPLMVKNAGNSGRPAISSLDGLPIIAVEACREHLVCLHIS
ncbi:hypothetical protein KSP40_PGU012774 [Platanthera guangdongensis]|uniref:Uncharacterized protein n=1 Tax=Platanthera guangdongensis TaxID=2320717 RepID=A0ABR2LS70_9ASPA